MKPDVDYELVGRSLDGDRFAMEELVARYQDQIHGFVCRHLDRNQAEDITQDVFLKVFDKLPDFRGDSSFRTWLYTLALNRCRDEMRRGKHRRHLSLDQESEYEDGLSIKDRIADSNPGPEAKMLELEESERLQRALNRLDDETRQIVLMRDMQQLPYDIIARVAGIPEGTVKSRLHYGRKKLGELMKKARL